MARLDTGINSAAACWHHWILLLKTTSSGGLYIFLAVGTLQVSVGLSNQSHVDFMGHTPHVFRVADFLDVFSSSPDSVFSRSAILICGLCPQAKELVL